MLDDRVTLEELATAAYALAGDADVSENGPGLTYEGLADTVTPDDVDVLLGIVSDSEDIKHHTLLYFDAGHGWNGHYGLADVLRRFVSNQVRIRLYFALAARRAMKG